MSLIENAVHRFDALLAASSGAEKALRQRAWDEYTRQGLPTRKTETWKYSQVAVMARPAWAEAQRALPILAEALRLRTKYQDRFDVLVVQNGELRADVSNVPAGVTVLQGPGEGVAPVIDDGVIGLAVAVNSGGLHIRVAAGTRLAKPMLVVHAVAGDQAWASGLHQWHFGEHAEAQIAEVFVGPEGAYLRTDVTYASLARGAKVSWLRMQSETLSASHFSELQTQIESDASLNLTQLNGGAAWERCTLRADVRGSGGEAWINGLTFARAQQHVDQRVVVSHHAASTASAQVFKGVLKDRAKGILNGKIFIAKDAQKVNSSQLNHCLLLSPSAEANTKPELEIYADDVKANHGAAIGRLDENKLFYLISRGIPRALAQQMLAHAFVADVLMKQPARDLRGLAEDFVARILPEFSSEMEREA